MKQTLWMVAFTALACGGVGGTVKQTPPPTPAATAKPAATPKAAPTPAAKPAAQAVTVKLVDPITDDPGCGDCYTLDRSHVSSIKASSVLDDSPRYAVENLLDPDKAKAWVEGAKGDGVGEWAEITFNEPTNLAYVTIWPGYLKSAKTLFDNGRPAKLKLTTDAGHAVSVTIPEYPEGYPTGPGHKAVTIELADVRPVSSVRLTIDGVHPGRKDADACISLLMLEAMEEL